MIKIRLHSLNAYELIRSIIEPYCELASSRHHIEVVNNDERIEKNSFLYNDALDDHNIENGDVSCMNFHEWHYRFWDYKFTFFQNDEEISESIQSLNVTQRQIFDKCFDMGKRKSKTETFNQTQGGETI